VSLERFMRRPHINPIRVFRDMDFYAIVRPPSATTDFRTLAAARARIAWARAPGAGPPSHGAMCDDAILIRLARTHHSARATSLTDPGFLAVLGQMAGERLCAKTASNPATVHGGLS
jgi:hypothetical protein